MEELIINIILNSEEDAGFIGDAVEIGNVVLNLIEDGVEFNVDVEELNEMIDENDILQLTKVICEDCGEISYIVEEVFDDEGYTIPDELDTLYIDSDLVDCIDLDAFSDTEIVIVEFELEGEEFECNGDCENCTLHGEEYEDEEQIGDILAQELFDSLVEVDKDDFETMIEIIADKLQEAYELGKDDSIAELNDAIDAIKSLK